MQPKAKRVCNKCGDPAKIWDKNAWWCGITRIGMGNYNLGGFCKKEKTK